MSLQPRGVARRRPAMATTNKIPLKLLVNNEKNQVVLAESNKDFIDILLSFLTLPMATIVRLLNNQSNLGSLDNLYLSIINLDPHHLQTEACKRMLLRPLNSSAVRCERLKVTIDDSKEARTIYSCKKSDCCSKGVCFMSSVIYAPCGHCGEVMDSAKTWKEGVVADEVGGFVKEGLGFMVTDDLCVMPATTKHSLALLEKLGIRDVKGLEERTLYLGKEEVLNLLKWALVSEMPLTRLCFPQSAATHAAEKLHTKELIHHPVTVHDSETNGEFRKININLLMDKANNKVVYAEVGEDLLDLLFSFLTFPLGSVISLLNKNSRIGCMDNLYKSVEALDNDVMESNECKSILLSPKLAPFYGCGNQILKMDEALAREVWIPGCHKCYWEDKFTPVYFLGSDFSRKSVKAEKCEHGIEFAVFRELNPKMSNGETKKGGGFVKGPGRFMVTDNICMSPFSPISAIETIEKSSVPFSRLTERGHDIYEVQALHLLRAVLTSEDALSDVFSCAQEEDAFGLVAMFRSSSCS